jgi:tetratricopeptide (TPR) repeat protein
MKHRTRITVVALGGLALFVAARPARGQGTQSQSQQQQQPPAQQNQKPSLQNPITNAVAPVATPVDPKEEAAYKSFFDMKPATEADYDKEIQAGEDFLKTYPQSKYAEIVYSRLTNSYFERQELDKMYDAGEKALALNGDDVSVLTLLGSVLPRGNSNDPQFKDKLAKAEQYDRHALELLPTLPMPAGVTADQFAKLKATAANSAHGGLGIALFREGKVEDSAAELQKATDGNPSPDPTDLYVLGLALNNLQKYADAEKAFDGCAQITSSLQDRCKQNAADAKNKAANQLQPPKL